jgi:hypothetical protein
MKKILTSFAKHFRRFTANSFTHDPEPASSPQSPAPEEKEIFESLAKTPLASVAATSSSISTRKSGIHPQRAILKANEAQSTNSFSPDFITRQELKGELDLLRRLIESRK